MYLCTSVTAGIYTLFLPKTRFVRVTTLPDIFSIYDSSNKIILELEYLLCLSTSMYVTVSSKQSLWKGWYGRDSYSMETLVTLGKSDGTSWSTDRTTVIATSHWWWVVSDVNWNFSRFNTKFSTVWDVPLSDGYRICSEQVQSLGNLKQLQVKENFIIPPTSATWGPMVPQTEYVWWLRRKDNYGMLSEIKYTKLPNKMYKI